MWKIAKPDLQKAISDVDCFKANGVLDVPNDGALKSLVRQYDSQNGSVTDAQHNAIPSAVADSIHKNYSNTHSGKTFCYIRAELNENVNACPYCGIGEVCTLDHYMPKSKYKALSLCRMNLVPMCWLCNGIKNTKPYSNFVHPYYTNIPVGVEFLKAEITVVGDVLVVRFKIDGAALNNLRLTALLKKHISEMDLDGRLMKSVIDFLSNTFTNVNASINELIETTKHQLAKSLQENGLNHWKTAVLKTLQDELSGANGAAIMQAIDANKKNNREILV